MSSACLFVAASNETKCLLLVPAPSSRNCSSSMPVAGYLLLLQKAAITCNFSWELMGLRGFGWMGWDALAWRTMFEWDLVGL